MHKILLFFVLASLLLLNACQTQTSGYRPIRGERTTPPPETPPTPEMTSPPPTNSLRDQLQHYLQNPPMSKVTYSLRSTIQENGKDHTITGIQIVALQGKNVKLQTETTLENQKALTAQYVLDGHYYLCQSDAQWTCYELPKPEQDPTPQIQQAIQEDLEKLDLQDGGSRTLLNTPVQCYTLTFESSEQEKGQTTHCYEKTGILLYTQTLTPTFETTLEAQSYTPQVNPQDFVLPAQPQPFPEPPTSE